MQTKYYGLCYRCEHRARYLNDVLNAPRDSEGKKEFVHSPRCECGTPSLAVHSCYMYRPVRPYILSPNENEDRGITLPPMLAGRAHAVAEAEGQVVVKRVRQGILFCFVPEGEKNAPAKKISVKRKGSRVRPKKQGKFV